MELPEKRLSVSWLVVFWKPGGGGVHSEAIGSMDEAFAAARRGGVGATVYSLYVLPRKEGDEESNRRLHVDPKPAFVVQATEEGS